MHDGSDVACPLVRLRPICCSSRILLARNRKFIFRIETMNRDPSVTADSLTSSSEHALLNFMMATSQDAVACISTEGRIVAFNRAAEELFGCSAEEMLGRNLNDILPLFADSKTAAEEKHKIARAAKGETIPAYETARLRRDGSRLHLSISTAPIRDRAGTVVGVARVVRDISARREYEQDKALLAQIVSSSSDAIVSYDLDGTLTSWNAGAQRIFGYSAAEMIGTTFEARIGKVTTPDNFAFEKAITQRAIAGEHIAPFEALRMRKDGSLVNVLMSISPVRDAHGRIIGIARFVRDISERKAHAQDRALLSQIVFSSSDAIISYTLDGIITSWNPAAERIYGYSAAEMIGTSIRERIGDFVIAPERVAEEIRLAERAAAGEHIAPFEAVRVRKDGAQVNVIVSISPILDANGAVMGISRIVRDVSERKASEAQRALLSSIVECSNDAIFTKTLDGTITSWNPAAVEMFGYSAEEIVGMPVLLLFSPDHVAEEVQILAQIRGGQTIRHYETVRVGKNEKRIEASVTASPIRDAAGHVIGVSNIVRDISERKQYETKLKAMQDDLTHVARLNELGQVSAGIAHELNQPLAALLNYANVAKRLLTQGDASAAEKARETVDKISDQAIRAGEIIRRMRSFVEKRQSNRTLEDINAVIEDTIALGFMGADARNLATRLKLEPNIPTVLIDRVQIQQVLVNLLHNAVDAMASAPKRQITLQTALVDGDTVDVRVSDTGPGIAPEHLERLFMPFFTTKPGGMGIGLVISRSIIEAHGGKITAERAPGGGAMFRFTLPVAD